VTWRRQKAKLKTSRSKLPQEVKITDYSANGFSESDQKTLSKVFVELDNRGSKVLLSNSNTDFIKELYSDFTIREVNASRAINCDASKRGRNKNTELIISNYLPVREKSYNQTSLDSI
jgi:DNA adenine methylase